MLTRLPPRCVIRIFLFSPMKRKLITAPAEQQASHKKRAVHRAMAAPPTLTLTEREQQLKGLLLDVAQFIDNNGSSDHEVENDASAKIKPSEPVVLRWAGGWVRDKLLGIESHDIDTAINCMTGEAFALRLRTFCESPEHRARHSIGPADVGNLHKIARNPDKSKHLETTTTRLFGLDVDFVNLRKETYSDESRNPQMEFGTAEEDALRRDATVNALFYNLNTGLVEDFTGGVADMRDKLIRTPMEPLQTFMDDPLRVLRLIRFASRLGFRIDEAAEEVMSDGRVLEALRLKISRERVGVELEKMLKGNNPYEALRLIDKLKLYSTIFTDPARTNMPSPDTTNWHAAYECIRHLAETRTPGSIYDMLVTSEEAAYFAWNLAALTPWEQLPDDPPLKNGKPAPPLATQAAREGFRCPNRLSDIITAAHRHRPQILALKSLVDADDPAKNERDRFGMAIREWDLRGGQWPLQILYSVLVDVEQRPSVSVQDVLAEWQRFVDHLVELDVMDAPGIKRIIDGRALAKELDVKPGKWTGPALEIVMAWQLRNPGVTDHAGAVEEVRKRKGGLGI
ncbi:mitochondrial CCA tRNA nucleotidyltransferase [Echria macrotheca]|uniref:Mitochondrial CCA tRNA nucleotidyltransferase n=1 Tax=Echria macrotheca TaxID=438768 RepID=A0AAJ0BEU6_9PEZI|nr:mitochondrial CCA tRNA nucleotidyltransferase [Echria macrotheca]